VQYFATYRVPEARVWARAEGGRLTRAAGYIGERGEAFGEAEPTEVERRLDWSVNPLTLARVASAPGRGFVGHLTEPLG
jgi:hypothetical protein